MSAPRLKVAVVDDEESIRRALQRLLRAAGMDVEAFSGAGEFLLALPHREFDCLVLDLHMPAMGGLQVQEELVRTGTRLPVVIITGHDKPEYRATAQAAGVAAYLPKPIEAGVLLGAIVAAARQTTPGSFDD